MPNMPACLALAKGVFYPGSRLVLCFRKLTTPKGQKVKKQFTNLQQEAMAMTKLLVGAADRC